MGEPEKEKREPPAEEIRTSSRASGNWILGQPDHTEQLAVVFDVLLFFKEFQNIGLLNQGWYQVNFALECEEGERVAPVLMTRPKEFPEAVPEHLKGYVDNDTSSFYTDGCKIRYSWESYTLNHVVKSRFMIPVKDKDFAGTPIYLKFDLLYAAFSKEGRLNAVIPQPAGKLEVVSSKMYRLTRAPEGQHHYCPVLFDTMHLAQLDVSIHTATVGFATIPSSQVEVVSTCCAEFPVSTSPLNRLLQWSLSGTRKPKAGATDELNSKLRLSDTSVDGSIHAMSILGILTSLTSQRGREPAENMAELLLRPMFKSISGLDALSEGHALKKKNSLDAEDIVVFDLNGKIQDSTFQPTLNLAVATISAALENRCPVERARAFADVCSGIAKRMLSKWGQFSADYIDSSSWYADLLLTKWKSVQQEEVSRWVLKENEVDLERFASLPPTPQSTTSLVPQIDSIDEELTGQDGRRRRRRVLQYLQEIRESSTPYPFLVDTAILQYMDKMPVLTLQEMTSTAKGRTFREFCERQEPPPAQRAGSVPKHLFVFVHGLLGHSSDLRLFRDNLALYLGRGGHYLMSDSNHDKTFESFDIQGHNLAVEIAEYISWTFEGRGDVHLDKISFFGHSIGNVVIRSALMDPLMQPYKHLMYSHFSISGPHLGYLYSENPFVNSGMAVLGKVKPAISLQQVRLTDSKDFEETYIYNLARHEGLSWFHNVVLVSSQQDKYVPYSSARLEMPPLAQNSSDRRANAADQMRQMCLGKMLERNKHIVRVDVHFSWCTVGGLSDLIGRRAHIEFLKNFDFVRTLIWTLQDYLN